MAILEICANSLQSAVNAEKGGAHRIELCQHLEGGGITPSIGLIRRVKQKLKIPVHVLIRPRTGDFDYSDDDFAVMHEDVLACRQLACDGVVIGILTRHNTVDVSRVSQLVRVAEPMSVTFHRAFDDCPDQFEALEQVIQTGCHRILTSGGTVSAVQGSARIAQLVELAQHRIVVMPGAGISVDNLEGLVKTTAATEYHTSAKTLVSSMVNSMFNAVQMQTDLEQVRALVNLMVSMQA